MPVLRAERGWSQADLAARLGVSRQTINAIERDRYHPSLPLAFEIAFVFEQPIETIFFPHNPSALSEDETDAIRSASESRAVQAGQVD